jgi:hypothetical protein
MKYSLFELIVILSPAWRGTFSKKGSLSSNHFIFRCFWSNSLFVPNLFCRTFEVIFLECKIYFCHAFGVIAFSFQIYFAEIAIKLNQVNFSLSMQNKFGTKRQKNKIYFNPVQNFLL